MKSYTFDEKDEFSKNGIKSVCSYLNTLKKTIEIKNVEDDKEYQKNGIDLVWIYRKGKNNVMISIEVKTDKYMTGNFWLETLSNEKIGTLGCFIKCKAKYLFYYFKVTVMTSYTVVVIALLSNLKKVVVVSLTSFL